jgi:hypothetical protein
MKIKAGGRTVEDPQKVNSRTGVQRHSIGRKGEMLGKEDGG